MLVPVKLEADVPQHVPKVTTGVKSRPPGNLKLLSCVRGTHHAACNQRLPEDTLSSTEIREAAATERSCCMSSFCYRSPRRDIASSSKARELWVGLEENAALALLQNIRIYALNLSQLREIRKRLMLPAGDNRFGYIAANSEHAP